ncbi:MAG: hypothetical protein LBU34_16000 [Planctomycetaceae bacterium]|nr:hypothetical protein [Planctomycetaceae bacterium]
MAENQKVGNRSPKGFHPHHRIVGAKDFSPLPHIRRSAIADTTAWRGAFTQRLPTFCWQTFGKNRKIGTSFEENLKIVDIPPCRFLGVGLQWVLLNLQPVLFLPCVFW